MTLFLTAPVILGAAFIVLICVLILVMLAVSPGGSEPGGRHKLGIDDYYEDREHSS